MTVIVDLGNVSDAPERSEASPHFWRLRAVRWAIPFVVAALLLAASGPALRPRLAEVANVPVGSYANVLIADDVMYVDSTDPPGPSSSTGRSGTIVAYRLSDGHKLWSMATDLPAGLGIMRTADGAIVVSDTNGSAHTTGTEVLDGATGRRLWTNPFSDAVLTAHGVLVAAPPSAFTTGTGYDDPSGFRLLDARTGAVLWSIDVPFGCTTAYEQHLPIMLVEACTSDSTLRTIDLADGRTVAKRNVELGQSINPAQLDPAQVMEQPQLMVISGLALVAHANVPTPTVDAYALDNLATRWTGVAEQQSQFIAACGDAICFYSAADGGSGVRFNVATGALMGPVQGVASALVPKGTLELRGATGSKPVAVPEAVPGQDISVGPDGTGDVWLERAPDELITPLPHTGATGCIHSAGYLVCATTNNRLRVWQVPERS